MFKKLILLAATFVLAPALASGSTISTLVVFGDSLSDQGNAFALTGGLFPPPPYAGNASNGPTAAQVMAGALGVQLKAAAQGGTNFAVVGAATGQVPIPATPNTTDNSAALTYSIPQLQNTGVGRQVQAYLLTGPVIDPYHELFMLWAGANDFFINPSAATGAAALANISGSIQTLYGAGARQFFVPNLPNIALTPYGLSLPPAQANALQALVGFYNLGLNQALTNLSALPGIQITTFDTFSLLTGVALNPSVVGLANATSPCISGDLVLGNATVCQNPDDLLFWDSLHPTAAGHRVIGTAFAAAVAGAVPEPSGILLVVSGLAVMGYARFSGKR